MNRTLFYHTGYLKNDFETLRKKQGLPSHSLANSCMNYKECNEDTMYPYKNVEFTYGEFDSENCPGNFK